MLVDTGRSSPQLRRVSRRAPAPDIGAAGPGGGVRRAAVTAARRTRSNAALAADKLPQPAPSAGSRSPCRSAT